MTVAGARAQTDRDAADFVLQEPIIISGGLTPVEAQSYGRAVTVVTGEDIERSNPRTFADLLRSVPGVSVSRGGGPGDLTQVRIRGAEANQVLVLIDGVRQADSASGYDFSFLSPELIQRIEIVRGPQALFGAGATAGVINVITKGGLREDLRLTGVAEGTTAPGGSVTGLVQGGAARADGALGIAYTNDAGWDTSGDGGEKDGAQNLTLNAKGSADLTDWAHLRSNFRVVDRTGEFDATVPGCGDPRCYVTDADDFESTGTDLLAGFALDVDTLGGALVHSPHFGYARSDTENERPPSPASTNDVSTLTAGYQAAYTFGAADQHTIAGAFQFLRDSFENSLAGQDKKRRNQYGYVAEYRGNLTDALFVQGALRYDDNEDFKDFFGFAASASYNFFSTGTRLRGSVGRAQTNPTFFELFGFIPGEFVGNPDLKPEHNLGWDVGVEQSFWRQRGRLSLTYFNETLQDEISGFGTTVDNLDGDSDRQGVEFGLTLEPLDALTLGLNYTYLDATEPDGKRELRRPRHAAAADAFYRFFGDRAELGVEVNYKGQTDQRDFSDPSSLSPRVTVPNHLVVDVSAAYRVTDQVQVYGGVNNLFDANYEDVLGFSEQPVTGFAGLRMSF
ncbi:MAG: TonB-dependent receptor plug domain-containing protein [Alphaproteobacteria bacterium]